MSEREEKIRAKAYELWEAAGHPHGDDQRFWHEAAALIAPDAAPAEAAPVEAAAATSEDAATPTLVAAPTPKRTKKVAKPAEPAAPTLAATGPAPSKAAPKAGKAAKAKATERSPLH